MDTENRKTIKFTLQHDTTGVMAIVYHDTRAQAIAYTEGMVADLPLFFPEGKWEVLGVLSEEEMWNE